jgi:hypothetical protein
MNLKFCFLTPEQEKSQAENTRYTASDREALGLLVNGIYDLISILELYTMDNQNDVTDHLTSFQILKHLTEPVHKYFADTSGVSLENEREEGENGRT